MYVCMYVCVYLVMSPLVSSFVLWSYNVRPQTDHRNFISTVSFHLACCFINPLNAELNPICHLLALLGPHHILHVSRIRVKVQLSHPYRSCGTMIAFCNFNILLLLLV